MQEWYERISTGSQAKFRTRMLYLASTPQHKWEAPPRYPYAKRVGDKIWEIRFLYGRIQHRPLGFFGPEQGVFTFVLGAREQNGRFVPRNALAIAVNRKHQIQEDGERAHECTIFG